MAGVCTEDKQVKQAKQLPLALPEKQPAYSRGDYVLSAANEAAWRAGEAWLRSNEPVLILCGPEGAGKTHLAHALVTDAAAFLDVADFVKAPPKNPLIVIDDLPASSPLEFLTALESGIEHGVRFILAGEGHPAEWAKGLKDLRTRLEAAPRAGLIEPDEALIRAVIAKQFRDRQIIVDPAVIEYAAPRLPLTFSAAHRFVSLADAAAMAEKRGVTKSLVQKLIDNFSEGSSRHTDEQEDRE